MPCSRAGRHPGLYDGTCCACVRASLGGRIYPRQRSSPQQVDPPSRDRPVGVVNREWLRHRSRRGGSLRPPRLRSCAAAWARLLLCVTQLDALQPQRSRSLLPPVVCRWRGSPECAGLRPPQESCVHTANSTVNLVIQEGPSTNAQSRVQILIRGPHTTLGERGL